jgi:Spy/CpxP family protein refolding chaperone
LEVFVRKIGTQVVLVCLVAAAVLVATTRSSAAQAAAPQAAAPQAATPTPSVEEVLKSMRSDMQSTRADIIAKNLSLTADQAAKFWPVFNAYQKEPNVIMDAQLKSMQDYVDHYATLDDAAARTFINSHLERDAKMTALRQHWLAEFEKVVPIKVAARAMQIDRRLSNLAQLEISSQLPLVH